MKAIFLLVLNVILLTGKVIILKLTQLMSQGVIVNIHVVIEPTSVTANY